MIVFLVAAVATARRSVLAATDNTVPLAFTFGEFTCGAVGGEEGRARVIDALNEIHAQAPGVTFYEGVGGVVFKADECDECKVNGYGSVPNNDIQLGRCVTDKSAIIHEVLHKLGFQHEQFHPDAGDYVVVNASLLDSVWRAQWFNSEAIVYQRPFDICSVMMYPAESSFWPEGAVTYTARGQAALAECGSSILSEGDIATLNHVYPHTHNEGWGGGVLLAVLMIVLLVWGGFLLAAVWWP
jgi:hypothetical protein